MNQNAMSEALRHVQSIVSLKGGGASDALQRLTSIVAGGSTFPVNLLLKQSKALPIALHGIVMAQIDAATSDADVLLTALSLSTLLTQRAATTQIVKPYLARESAQALLNVFGYLSEHLLTALVRFIGAALDTLESEAMRRGLLLVGIGDVLRQRLASSRSSNDSSAVCFLIARLVRWPAPHRDDARFAQDMRVAILGAFSFSSCLELSPIVARALGLCCVAAPPSSPFAPPQFVLMSTSESIDHLFLSVVLLNCSTARRESSMVTPDDAMYVQCAIQKIAEVKDNNTSSAAALRKLELWVRETPIESHSLVRRIVTGPLDVLLLLRGPLSRVDDDESCAAAARFCAFAVSGNPTAVDRFAEIGGLFALRELLGDYAATILSSAMMLLTALVCVPAGARSVMEAGLVERAVAVLRSEVDGDSESIPETAFRHEVVSASILFLSAMLTSSSEAAAVPSSTIYSFMQTLLKAWDRLDVSCAADLAVLCLDAAASLLTSSSPLVGGSDLPMYANQWLQRVADCLVAYSAKPGVGADVLKEILLVGQAASRVASGDVKHPISEKLASCLVSLMTSFPTLRESVFCFLSLCPEDFIIKDASGLRELLADAVRSLERDLESLSAKHVPLLIVVSRLRRNLDTSRSLAVLLSGTASKQIPMSVRKVCMNALCETIKHETPGGADKPPVDLSCHMCEVILLCETDSSEEADSIANDAFEMLLLQPDASVRTLSRLAATALSEMVGYCGREWNWRPVDAPADADEAHDILVAVVPLLNGLLHRSRACSRALLRYSTTEEESGGLHLFFSILEISKIDLGLQFVAVFALANIITHSSDPTEAAPIVGCAKKLEVALAQLRSVIHVLYPSLSAPLTAPISDDNTHRAEQLALSGNLPSDAAASETVSTIYLLMERVIIAEHKHTSQYRLFPMRNADGDSKLWQWVCRDAARVPNACSLLLCMLQDEDGVRETMPPYVACEVREALRMISATTAPLPTDTRIQIDARLRLLQSLLD